MTANTANRETIRDAFATLLGTALVGTGLPVSVVYNYPVGRVEQTPTVYVSSSGTARQRAGIGDTRWNSFFVLDVIVLIRDVGIDASWTENDVEDAFDLIDKKIADVVANNRANANWNNISFVLDDAGGSGIPQPSEKFLDTEIGFWVEARKVYIQKMDT